MATNLTQPKWSGKKPVLQNMPLYKKSKLILRDYLEEVPGATRKVFTYPLTFLTKNIEKKNSIKNRGKKKN